MRTFFGSSILETEVNLTIKTNCHRVIGDGCIWEGISSHECLQSQSVSQSVFYQVLMVNDGGV